jgi:hypothetical protein
VPRSYLRPGSNCLAQVLCGGLAQAEVVTEVARFFVKLSAWGRLWRMPVWGLPYCLSLRAQIDNMSCPEDSDFSYHLLRVLRDNKHVWAFGMVCPAFAVLQNLRQARLIDSPRVLLIRVRVFSLLRRQSGGGGGCDSYMSRIWLFP